MAGLRTKTLGIYEKDTGRSVVCNVAGLSLYSHLDVLPPSPCGIVCIEPWHALPGAR